LALIKNNLIQHTDNIVIKRIHTGTNYCQSLIAQITDFGGATSMNEDVIDINGGFGQIAFTEPIYFDKKKFKRDEISDIYSLGVIFWEISSGRVPFENCLPELHGYSRMLNLLLFIAINGKREDVPPSTPDNYSLLYRRCWNQIRENRPKIDEIIRILKNEIKGIKQTDNKL
jgi:serine/threonine protein kinase